MTKHTDCDAVLFEDDKFCTQCGNEIFPSDRFCSDCGNEINDISSKTKSLDICDKKNVSILCQHYKLFDISENNHRLEPEEIEVYGIVRNNSCYYINNIVIKVSLGKKDEKAIQEEVFNFSDENIEPYKSEYYCAIFELNKSVFNNHATKPTLKSGIIINVVIVSIIATEEPE